MPKRNSNDNAADNASEEAQDTAASENQATAGPDAKDLDAKELEQPALGVTDSGGDLQTSVVSGNTGEQKDIDPLGQNDTLPGDKLVLADPVADVTPTPAEAKAMFLTRPDLAGVETTEGWKNRGEL